MNLAFGVTAKEWELPTSAAKYTFHFDSRSNSLIGISVLNLDGKTLFRTHEHQLGNMGESSFTISLDEGEVIVGLHSGAMYGKWAKHWDFRFIIMRDLVRDDLEACNTWHKLVDRAQP